MEPITILRSDALDILFEHRNKQYGAYELRRAYPKRLITAIGAMGVLVLLACLWFTRPNKPIKLTGPIVFIADTVTILPLPSESKPKPETRPPASQPSAPKAASQKYATTIVAPDDQQTDPLPEVNDLIDKQISTTTSDGPAHDNVTRPPAPEGNGTAAPIESPKEKVPEILTTAAVMPSFPGGNGALQRWLARNLRPQDGLEPGQRIKVIARFVVDVTGNITGIELTQTGGNPFDQEVLRVMKKMPKWNAGKQNGQPVSVWYNIPIIFETPVE